MAFRRSLTLPLIVCGLPAPAALAQVPSDPLATLSFLMGRWNVPPGDSALIGLPGLAKTHVVELSWFVGRMATRVREDVPIERPDGAELERTVYSDPARERIGFVAAAGRKPAEGRLS